MLSLGQGALFTLLFAAITAGTDHRSFLSVLPGALVAGVVFGALMGPLSARTRNRVLAGIPHTLDASEEQRRQGARAARRGPVPTDAITRQVAVHVAEQRLALAMRGRRRNLLIFGLGSVGYLAAGVWWSWWWLIGALVFAGFFIAALCERNRLRRRLAQLSA